jgi:CHAT domain-containing protein
VLAGCETGAGESIGDEGVFGMRRAFYIAGAGTLIASLWPVEEEPTRIWMLRLHRGRLSGLSTADAVREAGLEWLAVRRRDGLSTHPFYWAAFVAAGDWR